MENKVLKPCPFCGSDKVIVNQNTKNNRITYSVRCNSCYARGGATGFYKDGLMKNIFLEEIAKHIDLAIEKWNVRVNEE